MADLELELGKYKIILEYILHQKSRKCSKNGGALSKVHRSQLEGAAVGQVWDNLSIRIMIVTDYKPLNKIET